MYWLGRRPYEPVWRAMQRAAAARGGEAVDRLWCLEHEPVYTLGLAGRPEHLLPQGRDSGIAVVHVDRGGQITYHGPGQLIVYFLLDLRRRGLGVRALVHHIEQSVIDLLAVGGLHGERREGAPGVYLAGAKIAALGLRVKNGCTYHGLSLNVDLDLAPFAGINPCGYAGLAATRLRDHGIDWSVRETAERLCDAMQGWLGPLVWCPDPDPWAPPSS
ncbi:MAG: lipoyl(octanoyl) transferase LipB [Rhodocyclales bacterium]|nr:lipoyl(octanoyl) transferase LipB [Rhodocyclales bacterium]